jgi:hypothetical protein
MDPRENPEKNPDKSTALFPLKIGNETRDEITIRECFILKPYVLVKTNFSLKFGYVICLRACLYDPGQAGRDAYRDPARNTNSKECLYDPATYPA